LTSLDSEFFAEGGNYRATIRKDGIAYICVWRRPDVSLAVGAGYAVELIAVFDRFAMEFWTRVRGVLLDLTDAPSGWGPATEAALSDMFAKMEAASRRLAVLTRHDALYMMAIGKVLGRHAPRCGRAFSSPSSAHAWAGQWKRIST
jgi:hypothetical protein